MAELDVWQPIRMVWPPAPYAGLQRSGDGKVGPRFALFRAREIQISKDKIGRGTWRVRIEIQALGQAWTDSMVFPSHSTPDDPTAWATLDVY